jgi:hypothetical protein
LSNSPWIRGAPQRELLLLMARMSSRTSLEIPDLPELPCLHFQLQNRRKPLRCQAMTVSGLTMMRGERHWGQWRKSQIQRNRSQGRSFGRWMNVSRR